MSASMVERGWAALDAGDAVTARDAFERALEQTESGRAREGLGQALYLQRDYSGAITQHERAYTAYRRAGHTFAAGRVARILAWITGNVLGDWAVQNGWLARALRILSEVGDDTLEHGWVLIIKSYIEPDAAAREALFREAIMVGRRFGDPNIEFESLASRRSLSHDGPRR
jgi:tetratricopeptide (TPR) repeat protein